MAVLKNKDGTELLIDCSCGCDTGMRFRIDKEDADNYAFLSYTNGNWYRDTSDTIRGTIRRKLKRIWAIIRNKDYHYSDILMTKEEFDTFKQYINEV